jgi:serine-type D-Ala-D-Ala carboxypeptidase/endopeptidase (penicillin-binding protein 4)
MARQFAVSTARHLLSAALAFGIGHPGNSFAQSKTEPAAVAASATTPAIDRTALTTLVTWAEKRNVRLGVFVQDLESDAQLTHLPGVPLNPASNMKVLTAAAALDELGPSFCYETSLYGVLSQHRIETLTLRGNGDPSLGTHDLWALANTLVQMGLTHVGTLFVDQSRFDDQFTPPAFEQQPREWAAFRAPVSAIALARNTVTLNVLPTAEGEAARVWFEPEGIVVPRGQVKTVKLGGGQDIRLTLGSNEGVLHAEVGGHVAASLGRQRFDKRVEDPRSLPGLVLRNLLQQRGVTVDQVNLGTAPEKNRLVFHTSPPLRELVSELGKHSDNFYAEMVFKSLSIHRAGADVAARASSQASSAWLLGWVERIAGLPPGTQIINGSGLFDANRIAPETLGRVLRHSYFDPELRGYMLAHLAVGGVDGTLRSRFRDAPAGFPVLAKTGTLRDTIALSGYVLRPGTRPPVVFSIIANNVKTGANDVREHIDQFVRSLQH